MKITLNAEEVRSAIEAYVDNNVNLAGELDVVVNEDGTVTVGINEKVDSNVDDTPPVVEKKTRKPRESKHVMVESKPEPEVVVETTEEKAVVVEDKADPEPVETREEQVVKEDVQATEEEAKPSKPSLFSGLKR